MKSISLTCATIVACQFLMGCAQENDQFDALAIAHPGMQPIVFCGGNVGSGQDMKGYTFDLALDQSGSIAVSIWHESAYGPVTSVAGPQSVTVVAASVHKSSATIDQQIDSNLKNESGTPPGSVNYPINFAAVDLGPSDGAETVNTNGPTGEKLAITFRDSAGATIEIVDTGLAQLSPQQSAMVSNYEVVNASAKMSDGSSVPMQCSIMADFAYASPDTPEGVDPLAGDEEPVIDPYARK